MSIFTKPTTEKVPMRNDSSLPEAGLSVIASGMKIVGDIESTGVVKIEGIVEGTVHGDIRAHEVVIGGTVVGTIIADERVEIQGTSTVQGDIHTKSIVVLEGGVINGTVRMGEQAARDASRDGKDVAADTPLRPGLALRQ